MRDLHVRYPEDPAPIVPGVFREEKVQRERSAYISRPEVLRYDWARNGDPDVQRIREQVAEGAPGLYVMLMGNTGVKVLVEAYYPEDIRPRFFAERLDPLRKQDHCMGRLVAVGEIFKWVGELPGWRIQEVQRNHRNARRELRRSHNQLEIERGLHEAEEEKFQAVNSRWTDFYEEAMKDTKKFAMNAPRVSGYNPQGRR